MKPALNIPLGLLTVMLACFVVGIQPSAATRTDNIIHSDGVVLSAGKIAGGNALLVQIDSRSLQPPLTGIHLRFQQRGYGLYPHPLKPQTVYFAIIGIPYRSTPGPGILTLEWSNAAGRHTKELTFTIVGGKYKTDVLKVDSARVTLNSKNIKRAKKESRQLKRIYASASSVRLWNGPFQLPMQSQITSPFGNRRIFNGRLKSYHNGVDFRAPVGTPVFAANSGIVLLAQDLFYSGNVVVIDHGTGIFTIYAHLSKIEAAAGQPIEKGQQLGLTGATGRVSGPHLHWGVKVNGVAVDPMQFVETMAILLATH